MERAARRLHERDLLHRVPRELEFHREMVTAERVVALRAVVGGGEAAPVAGAPVVVHDDLLVELPEGVRRALSELRLPREEAKRLFDYIVEQSQRSKTEVLGLIGTEVKGFLRTLSLEDELRRALAGMKVKIQAEITFEEVSGKGGSVQLQTNIASNVQTSPPERPAPPADPPQPERRS